MNLNDMYPSTTLKSADFDDVGEMQLTIKKVEIKDIGQEGATETKPILSFNETEKTLVLNKTNAGVIGAMYGDKNVDVSWIGKQIVLHVEMTTFQGKATPGIRVKQVNEKQAAIDAFWAYASGTMFLTADEGRAVLKENGNDFVAALAALKNEPATAANAKPVSAKDINAALQLGEQEDRK